MFTIISVLLNMFFLIVLPVCIGNTICYIIKYNISAEKCFVVGHITILAICQLVAVPLIIFKRSFIYVLIILSIIYGLLFLYSVCNKKIRKGYAEFLKKKREKKIFDIISFVVMILAVILIVSASILLQHTDADDSRFVVNAVDIIRTNKMMLINPATGIDEGIWVGEVARDVVSPWAVYIAYISKLTGIHPTVMAHLILPIALLIMACVVYWLLAEEIFDKNFVSRCMFVSFLILLNIYGYYSLYGQETFFLTRIWQGKSIVAGIGIPLLILEFFWIYDDEKKIGTYLLIFLTEMALCLLSGMGILLGAMMAGAYGLIYGYIKKNWKMMLGVWLCVIPNIVCYAVSELI